MSKFLDLEGLGYYTQCFKPGLVELVDGGAKNLLDCSINALKQILTSGTWNNNIYTNSAGDISMTVNSDNTLTISATNVTANRTITIGTLGTNQGNLYFSCTPNIEGAGTKFRSGINYVGYDDGEGLNVPNLTTSRAIQLEIVGSSASPTTLSNIVYKPMLCTKSKWNISQTYQPYRPSEDEQNAQIAVNTSEITLLRTFMAYVGYAEVTEVNKRDDERRLNVVTNGYYAGIGTVNCTGMLVSNKLPLDTDLTVENCQGDARGAAYAVTGYAKDMDNGLGVSIKPYIEIDNVRHYGVQQRYFYNDL